MRRPCASIEKHLAGIASHAQLLRSSYLAVLPVEGEASMIWANVAADEQAGTFLKEAVNQFGPGKQTRYDHAGRF